MSSYQKYVERIVKEIIQFQLIKKSIKYDIWFSLRLYAWGIKAWDEETKIEFIQSNNVDSTSPYTTVHEMLVSLKFFEILEEFRQYRNKLWC